MSRRILKEFQREDRKARGRPGQELGDCHPPGSLQLPVAASALILFVFWVSVEHLQGQEVPAQHAMWGHGDPRTAQGSQRAAHLDGALSGQPPPPPPGDKQAAAVTALQTGAVFRWAARALVSRESLPLFLNRLLWPPGTRVPTCSHPLTAPQRLHLSPSLAASAALHPGFLGERRRWAQSLCSERGSTSDPEGPGCAQHCSSLSPRPKPGLWNGPPPASGWKRCLGWGAAWRSPRPSPKPCLS